MGYYDPDPYYQPEKFGLTIVAEEDDGGSYEFNMFVIWKHEDGRVFYSTDSGCSCPSPFEWADKLEDLELLSDWEDFEQEVTVWSEGVYNYKDAASEMRHNLLMAGAKALAP